MAWWVAHRNTVHVTWLHCTGGLVGIGRMQVLWETVDTVWSAARAVWLVLSLHKVPGFYTAISQLRIVPWEFFRFHMRCTLNVDVRCTGDG